jgi:AAA+ ATPase superfamily predicted ATPase
MQKTKPLMNPFPVNSYQGSSYFCDREKETKGMLSLLMNGNSVTLMAIRRMGKTGLIHHCLSQLPKNWKGIYIDILETENLNAFLNILATSIANALPQRSSPGKKFWNFLKSLRPVIGFDQLNGSLQVSFDLKKQEVESNINNILTFLDSQDFQTVIAIDEFQQILNYPEKSTDAWLRSRIQQLKNTVFIFSGSQQHLMSDLFLSPSRPFFRSSQLMKLGKIDHDTYLDFILGQFKRYQKKISVEVIREILSWTNTHTYYVQQVCNRVFANTADEVTEAQLKETLYNLLREQEHVFFAFRNLLTNPQWQLLKAIAREGKVFQPTSRKFMETNNLGSSPLVMRSLTSLIQYELVYRDTDEDGKSFLSVYDVFLQRWVGGK